MIKEKKKREGFFFHKKNAFPLRGEETLTG